MDKNLEFEMKISRCILLIRGHCSTPKKDGHMVINLNSSRSIFYRHNLGYKFNTILSLDTYKFYLRLVHLDDLQQRNLLNDIAKKKMNTFISIKVFYLNAQNVVVWYHENARNTF